MNLNIISVLKFIRLKEGLFLNQQWGRQGLSFSDLRNPGSLLQNYFLSRKSPAAV